MGQGRFEKRVAALMPSTARIVQLSPDIRISGLVDFELQRDHAIVVIRAGTADR